jgi:hypothetical protein
MNLSRSPICFLASILAAFGLSVAGDVSDSAKTALDSTRNTLSQVGEIHSMVKDLHQGLVESPIQGKNWGVEVDPFFLLFSSSSFAMINGTVSNFSFDRSAEIAFPFSYEFSDENSTYLFDLDAHYRYFLSGIQKGFYIGGFVRYQYESYLYSNFDDNSQTSVSEKFSSNRGGLGFEIGDRVFSRKGWYWGWSLDCGRLFGNEGPDSYASALPNALFDELILDVELLKVGFAF